MTIVLILLAGAACYIVSPKYYFFRLNDAPPKAMLYRGNRITGRAEVYLMTEKRVAWSEFIDKDIPLEQE